jgi:hypothetical protein
MMLPSGLQHIGDDRVHLPFRMVVVIMHDGASGWAQLSGSGAVEVFI